MFVVTVLSSGKDFNDVHFFISAAPESAITTVHRPLQEENFLGENSPRNVV